MGPRQRAAALVSADGDEVAISRYLDQAIGRALDELGPDEVAPTEPAQASCRQHLAAVAQQWPAGRRFPLPRVSGSGDGDILCQWRRADRKALVVFMRDGAVRAFTARMEEQKTIDTNVTSAPSPAETRDALVWVGGS
jgi:hypothetical protein